MRKLLPLFLVCLALAACATPVPSARLSNAEIKALLADVSIQPVGNLITADFAEFFYADGGYTNVGRASVYGTFKIANGAVCIYDEGGGYACRIIERRGDGVYAFAYTTAPDRFWLFKVAPRQR